jgi:hypothetical protein
VGWDRELAAYGNPFVVENETAVEKGSNVRKVQKSESPAIQNG